METEEYTPLALDSILNGDSADVVPEPKAESEPEAQEADKTGDSEESTPDSEGGEAEASTKDDPEKKGDSEGDGEPQSESDAEKGLKAALAAERRKRQELEKKFKSKEAEQKAPSVFEDEEGYNKSIDDKIRTAELKATLKMSNNLLAKEIGQEGVNEVWNKFSGLFEEHPGLEKRFGEHEHPFEFAREQVKKFETLAKIESGEIDKELDERLEKMLEEKLAAMEKTDDEDVPASLAGGSGAGVKSNSFTGPTPLDSILSVPE